MAVEITQILVIDQDWEKIQTELNSTPDILETKAEHWYLIELSEDQINTLKENDIWFSYH